VKTWRFPKGKEERVSCSAKGDNISNYPGDAEAVA